MTRPTGMWRTFAANLRAGLRSRDCGFQDWEMRVFSRLLQQTELIALRDHINRTQVSKLLRIRIARVRL